MDNAPHRVVVWSTGVELDEIRGRLDRRLTDRDIDVAFGTIPAGTVGAVRTVASGAVDGEAAIVVDGDAGRRRGPVRRGRGARSPQLARPAPDPAARAVPAVTTYQIDHHGSAS